MITNAEFDAFMEKIKGQGYRPPVIHISAEQYQAALAAGVSHREVEMILAGASPTLAKQMARGVE